MRVSLWVYYIIDKKPFRFIAIAKIWIIKDKIPKKIRYLIKIVTFATIGTVIYRLSIIVTPG